MAAPSGSLGWLVPGRSVRRRDCHDTARSRWTTRLRVGRRALLARRRDEDPYAGYHSHGRPGWNGPAKAVACRRFPLGRRDASAAALKTRRPAYLYEVLSTVTPRKYTDAIFRVLAMSSSGLPSSAMKSALLFASIVPASLIFRNSAPLRVAATITCIGVIPAAVMSAIS